MTAFYVDAHVTLQHGDCLDVLRTMPDGSIDAVVTDPPYDLTAGKKGGSGQASLNIDTPYGRARIGTGFMGLGWDATGIAFRPEVWIECLRVLKPGGHLLAFGGSRTWHRMTVAIEDAGFEVRDSIAWLYGSGFPKSLDVSKAIDKAAEATREIVGIDSRYVGMSETAKRAQGATAHDYSAGWVGDPSQITAPATPAAQQWQGWGTALKPAFEPIVVARKPLIGTVAANVLAHGTGALNIDATRVPASDTFGGGASGSSGFVDGYEKGSGFVTATQGRWPANVLLGGDAAAELDRQSGTLTSGKMRPTHTTAGVAGRGTYGKDAAGGFTTMETYGDSGGASRFFPQFTWTDEDRAWQDRVDNLPTFRYEAKAPTAERPRAGDVAHPTVKPLDLMRWLVRLVTPPGGTVLEPFAGSGTTAEACVVEGFHCIAVEREAAYLPLIVARLSKPIQPDLFGGMA